MARLATSAAHFCQRLQELYPHKLAISTKQQSEQSSPFRRWTTGSGAGSSYRHHDHRNMYNKQISEGSTPVSNANAGSSNVARWSLGLEQLLADPAGAAAFTHFLAKEFASENLRFWWACEQYSSIEDGAKRAALAGEIWQRHLDEKASEPVNVDAAARRAAALVLYHDPPPPDLFQQAQKQIFNVMKFDSYPRFLRSPEHAECARADLRGLPCPYAPAPPEPDNSSPTKLKKSASNVSERRRSGGTSLLPWKLRHASRDRLNVQEPQPVTDVVKSSQVPGQPLCRVLLPDGATSVVPVESGVSVARLVERLLQRRNLACATYDVTLKEPRQGEASTLDLQAPSTVLGGREVAVERRAVVRLELGSRCVAVRCRAARRLRHVLRPVLRKYALPAPRQVLRDGVPVNQDTLMQDLDGCRLQVVEQCGGDGSDAESAADGADAESAAGAELALRHDDRDICEHSNSTTSSRSNSGANSTSSVTSSTGAPGAPGVGAVNGGGRVRAALRPGPPLHHHPPDFLENLRETQRRFQGKELPAPTPPGSAPAPPCAAPAPRTPPPLPPKPAHRPAPTLV